MDAFIEATDQLSDNFEPPERSDTQLRWGYYVTYKAIDGDMLTPANLKTVQETEAMLTNLTGDYFKVTTCSLTRLIWALSRRRRCMWVLSRCAPQHLPHSQR